MLLEVEEALRQHPLYFMLIHIDASEELSRYQRMPPQMERLPVNEVYEIGPKTNYHITTSTGMKAMSISRDSVRIYLKDVLLDGQATNEGDASSYDFSLTTISEDANGIRVEGILERQIEYVTRNRGRDNSGATLIGYVDQIQRGTPERSIKLPEF